MINIVGTIQTGTGQAGTAFALPTANLSLASLPQTTEHGVYASRATVGGHTYNGITFIGQAHLLEGKPWRLETHFFGATGDFVGQTLELELVKFMRSPVVFTSPEHAAKMIAADVAAVQSYFSNL